MNDDINDLPYSSVLELHRDVHRLSGDLDNLQLLLDIQRRLLRLVQLAEVKIKEAKADGLNPEAWQYYRYNLLTIGDSIAFLYCDRFALKQMFFNTENQNPKQTSGFVSGKYGLKAEILMLEWVLSHSVPAILCDLTNVIRYGDVCLLDASDPFPIEVKSTKGTDSRSIRQKRKLKRLIDFLATDRAENYRGFSGPTIRLAGQDDVRSYVDMLRLALGEALNGKSNSFTVEDCLTIFVISEGDVELDSFRELNNEGRYILISLNEIKAETAWSCFFPYALSLSDPDQYEAFIKGKVVILGLLNIKNFERHVAPPDVALRLRANENEISCEITLESSEGPFSGVIGQHMMLRIWTDLICPSWIIQNAVFMLRQGAEVPQ